MHALIYCFLCSRYNLPQLIAIYYQNPIKITLLLLFNNDTLLLTHDFRVGSIHSSQPSHIFKYKFSYNMANLEQTCRL